MGGAAGHMKHPFETHDIGSGRDLLNKFITLASVLSENQPTLKLDGANTSFKVINTDNNNSGIEFALDRGTQQVQDIEGITLSNMQDRFLSQADVEVIASDDPSLVGLQFAKRIDWFVKNTNSKNSLSVGDAVDTTKPFTMNRKKMPLMTLKVKNIRQHGMIATATKQLTLLNKVFEVYPDEAKAALQRMGMVDEEGFAISESFLINTEFVDESESGGAANLIKYGMEQPVKFLAFHGLIEIRPDPKARADFISNYPTYTINQGDVGNALNQLTDLIENANRGSGWEFFDASRYRVGLDENVTKINISEALSQKITINLNNSESESLTIEQWLSDPRIKTPPKSGKGYQSFTIGGIKAQPISKDLYGKLINAADGSAGPSSLEDLAPGDINVQNYILTGAIYYHATKVVGRSIKSQMTNLTGLGPQNIVTIYDTEGKPTNFGHEGIAIQHPDLGIDQVTGYPYIIKVVGDFLVSGAMGRFAVRESIITMRKGQLKKLIEALVISL